MAVKRVESGRKSGRWAGKSLVRVQCADGMFIGIGISANDIDVIKYAK